MDKIYPGFIFMKYNFASTDNRDIVGQVAAMGYISNLLNQEFGNELFSMYWISDFEAKHYVLIHGVERNFDRLEQAVETFIVNIGTPNYVQGTKPVVENIRNKFYQRR